MINLDLKSNRKNVCEYLKEFKRVIPKKGSMFSRNPSVDISKLGDKKDKIESFFERGIMISPMLIDKNSINVYIENLRLVKQFPNELRPETVMESRIAKQTENAKNTRNILIPSVIEKNSSIMDNYNKMVAYYLLMGEERPVERFSKIEMAMKQYGVKPDIGLAIMKYGDEITTKLEELATAKVKSPKEWEFFKSQVLHSFMIAEKIGNRSVNLEEHTAWEERLIKLGILERRQEKEETKKQAFKQSIRYDVEMKKPDGEKGKVALDRELLRRAEQQYINTGVVPLGYKKNQKGKIVRNLPTMEEDKRDRLSAGNNLSASNKKRDIQELTR